jgi:hypothetical protein
MQSIRKKNSSAPFNNFNNYIGYAERDAAAKGNAPGFNSQFQYPEGAITNSSKEFLNSRFDGGKAIPQIKSQRRLLTGEYGSMVPDIPFDLKAHKNQKANLMAFGLAALVVGFLLYQRG